MTALAVAAMAVDHLMGDDPAVLEDPFAFALSAVLCVALAAFVFGRLVPRTKAAHDRGERAATRVLALSALAVIGAPLVCSGSGSRSFSPGAEWQWACSEATARAVGAGSQRSRSACS